jgi:putative FmdB family regulatory protein
MPTYEYECEACGHAFEMLQSMTDKKITKCPECKKNKLYRLIGRGSGVIFKGTGFYETDYKQKTASIPSSAASKPVKSSSCGCGSSHGGCSAGGAG